MHPNYIFYGFYIYIFLDSLYCMDSDASTPSVTVQKPFLETVPVIVQDSVDPVCYGYDGAVLESLSYRVLDELVSLWVN